MDTAEQLKAICLSMMDVGFSNATPSKSVWADIETVALRAPVTLHWAMQNDVGLSQSLTQLVHALLAGHVMDEKLDMTNVLKFGLAPVLGTLSIETYAIGDLTATCLRQLAGSFLRRLTTDMRAFKLLYRLYGLTPSEVFEERLDQLDIEEPLKYPAVKPMWLLLRKLCFSEFCCLRHFFWYQQMLSMLDGCETLCGHQIMFGSRPGWFDLLMQSIPG